MSLEFAGDWLALREPADHAARDNAATAAACAWASGQDHLRILDLGSGRGSNLRFLAPRLAVAQRWTLVDHDPALLAEAQASIGDIDVTPSVVDLRTADLDRLVAGHELVTAAAFLDLVSDAWLDRLVTSCAASGASLLLATSVDGRVDWAPPVAGEAAVASAFRDHQEGDKGFGGALGIGAPGHLAEALRASGWSVSPAQADWVLDAASTELQSAYLAGVVAAVSETELDPAVLAAWHGGREAAIDHGQSRLRVGHLDVFATRGSAA